jgi:hypothetical protein
MNKRYADKAKANSDRRAEELAGIGDHAGVAVWHRIADAIEQLTKRSLQDHCTDQGARGLEQRTEAHPPDDSRSSSQPSLMSRPLAPIPSATRSSSLVSPDFECGRVDDGLGRRSRRFCSSQIDADRPGYWYRDVTDAGQATDISSFRERVIGRGRTHMRCCGNIACERHPNRCWDWASEQPA